MVRDDMEIDISLEAQQRTCAILELREALQTIEKVFGVQHLYNIVVDELYVQKWDER